MKLIYWDAPFAYLMGYLTCVALSSNEYILAALFVVCYLGIHVLTTYERDGKYK